MTSRIQKRLLLPKRVRHPPREGFSWVDRRFLKDYAARLSRDAILLYFFFLCCQRSARAVLLQRRHNRSAFEIDGKSHL